MSRVMNWVVLGLLLGAVWYLVLVDCKRASTEPVNESSTLQVLEYTNTTIKQGYGQPVQVTEQVQTTGKVQQTAGIETLNN